MAAFVVCALDAPAGFRVGDTAEVETLLADVYAVTVVSGQTGSGLFRGRAAVLFVGGFVVRLLPVGRQDFFANASVSASEFFDPRSPWSERDWRRRSEILRAKLRKRYGEEEGKKEGGRVRKDGRGRAHFAKWKWNYFFSIFFLGREEERKGSITPVSLHGGERRSEKKGGITPLTLNGGEKTLEKEKGSITPLILAWWSEEVRKKERQHNPFILARWREEVRKKKWHNPPNLA